MILQYGKLSSLGYMVFRQLMSIIDGIKDTFSKIQYPTSKLHS